MTGKERSTGTTRNISNLSLWLSVISLVGVVTFTVLWICNVRPQSVVSLDSFVGVATGLIGIMVTFAIGWQIVNAMELKSKISELERSKTEMSNLHQQQRQQLTVLRVEIARLKGFLAHEKGRYAEAFSSFHFALCERLTVPLPPEVLFVYLEEDMKALEELLPKIKPGTLSQDEYEGIRRDDMQIRQSRLYNMISGRYEPIMSEFFRKVSHEE